jgi:hypothetical protein
MADLPDHALICSPNVIVSIDPGEMSGDGEVYLIHHYVIKFIIDLRHDITEILMQMPLNTLTLTWRAYESVIWQISHGLTMMQ